MVAQTLEAVRAAGSDFCIRDTDACKLGFIPWVSSFFSLLWHIHLLPFRYKGDTKIKRRKKNLLPLVYGTEKLSKPHSRASVLLCIQSRKLSVFEGSAVTGLLHGEITCCSPSLKMLTLSLTSDCKQKHVPHACWLNGSVSALWKRLACICQSSDLTLCAQCKHMHMRIHI